MMAIAAAIFENSDILFDFSPPGGVAVSSFKSIERSGKWARQSDPEFRCRHASDDIEDRERGSDGK